MSGPEHRALNSVDSSWRLLFDAAVAQSDDGGRAAMPACRLFLVISAVNSFCHATAYTLYLVYQIETVGLDPLQLVLVGTALEVVCFVAQVPTGVIADARGRKLSVVVGYLLMGVGTLVTASVPTFGGQLLGTAVWGVGACCVDGALQAWLTDELGAGAAAPVFSRATQLGLIGAIVGIGASVALGGVWLSLPLAVGGLSWVLLGAALPAVMVERNFIPAPSRAVVWTPRQLTLRTREVTRLVGARRVLLMLVGAILFLGLGSEGFDRLQTAHFLIDLGLPGFLTPVVWFGLMSVAGMALAIAATELIRRRVNQSDSRQVIAALAGCALLTVLGVVAFGLAGSFWLGLAAVSLVGVARTVTSPLLTAGIALNSDSAGRATVFSIAGQADALGQIGGGPGVGVVGQRAGVPAALVCTGLLMTPAVALLGVAYLRSRRSGTIPKGQAPLLGRGLTGLEG